MTKKVIATRMSDEEMAKARDGLLSKGIKPSQINTVSKILKLTFYYGLISLCEDPKASASYESLMFIKNRLIQNKPNGPVTLEDLIKSAKQSS